MQESEVSIDALPEIDYSINPRRIIHYAGETAGIVSMNPKDPEDMKRVRRIEREAIDSNPIFARGKDTDQKLVDWVDRKGIQGKWNNKEWMQDFPNEWPGIPIGVAGIEKVGEEDKGELLGWVQFYPPDPNEERYNSYQEEGILKESKLPLVEISYGKLPDAPPGHMASGLRQACLYLAKDLETDDPNGRPDLPIIAYVATDNTPSIHVLEASGFERKKELNDLSNGLDEYFYVLNWDKLHETVQSKADATLNLKPDS